MSARISGQRWAYCGLVGGIGFSILGNVTHTVLAQSGVAMAIRVPLAVIWPVFLFVAIEVLVRVDWRERFIDHIGRAVLWVPVGMVSAVVSYRHLHSLLSLADPQDWFSALIGPAAIDGLMLGCTAALLSIRFHQLAGEMEGSTVSTPVRLAYDHARPIGPEPLPEFSLEQLTTPGALPEAPVSPAPAGVRRPRNPDAMSTAVQQITTGQSVTAVSDASAKRLVRVWRELRNNPNATIPADWKVTGELVEKMRSAARTEINR